MFIVIRCGCLRWSCCWRRLPWATGRSSSVRFCVISLLGAFAVSRSVLPRLLGSDGLCCDRGHAVLRGAALGPATRADGGPIRVAETSCRKRSHRAAARHRESRQLGALLLALGVGLPTLPRGPRPERRQASRRLPPAPTVAAASAAAATSTTAATPADAAGAYRVFVPIDAQQKPTGGKVYLPEPFYQELYRRASSPGPAASRTG